MSTSSAVRNTVVDLVKEALWPIAGVEPPASSITSTSVVQEQKLRAIVNDIARKLRSEGGFNQQKKTYTFDLVASTTSYQLPKDFYRPVFDSHWDTDQQWPLDGPLPDNIFRSRVIRQAGSIVTAYRIFGSDRNPNSGGGQFHVYPTPSGGETLAFDYYTRHLFLPPYWLPSTVYAVGDYVQNNGEIYICDTNGTSDTSGGPTGTTDNQTDGTTQWDHFDDAYETIQTNNDLPIFDDEAMILGIRVGYLKSTGKDFTTEQVEFLDAIKTAKGRWLGSHRGSMKSRKSQPRYQIPIRSWSL